MSVYFGSNEEAGLLEPAPKTPKQRRKLLSDKGCVSSHRATYTGILLLMCIEMFCMILTTTGMYMPFAYSPSRFQEEEEEAVEKIHPAELHEVNGFITHVFLVPLFGGLFLIFLITSLVYQTFNAGIRPKILWSGLGMSIFVSVSISSWACYAAVDLRRFPDDSLGIGNSFFNVYNVFLHHWQQTGQNASLTLQSQKQRCCGLYGADDFWTGRKLRNIGGKFKYSLNWASQINDSAPVIKVVPEFCCRTNETGCNTVTLSKIVQPNIWACGCGIAIIQPMFAHLQLTTFCTAFIALLSICTIIITWKQSQRQPRKSREKATK